jgi:hypothetical protein
MRLLFLNKNKYMFSICNNHDDSLWKIRILITVRMEKETKGEKMVERKWKLLGNGQGLTILAPTKNALSPFKAINML